MSKKARSEGNRVAMAIKASKSDFYVSDVNLEDNHQDVINCVVAIQKTLGKCEASFLIISAGVKKLIVAVRIHEKQSITASDWLSSSLSDIHEEIEEVDDKNAYSYFEIDTPFKLKDTVRANAFAFLRKHGLLEEEESEEEYFDF